MMQVDILLWCPLTYRSVIFGCFCRPSKISKQTSTSQPGVCPGVSEMLVEQPDVQPPIIARHGHKVLFQHRFITSSLPGDSDRVGLHQKTASHWVTP